MSNLRLKLAHLIAGKELQAEQSRRNRVFKKMVWGYVFTLWGQEAKCDCDNAMYHLQQRLEEAEGEQK